MSAITVFFRNTNRSVVFNILSREVVKSNLVGLGVLVYLCRKPEKHLLYMVCIIDKCV